MITAISYDRYSTPEQGKGDSGRRQSTAAADFCAQNALELDTRYIDRGVSGWRGKNVAEGDLRRLIEDAEGGRITPGTFLLIENFDRLSRLPLMRALRLFSSLLDLGLVIVNLTDGRKYTSDSLDDLGELLTPLLLMSRANEESNRKSGVVRKAKAARRERVRAGDGVKMTRIAPHWLKPKGSGEKFDFVPIAERVEIARRVLEECAFGLGKRAIATRLNKAGVPAFRGKNGWHHSSVAKLIANDALVGIFHPCRIEDGRRVPDGPPIERYYPAVVPAELFWRAQAAVESRDRKNAGAKGKGYANLFSGLLRCTQCGSALVYLDKGRPPKGGQYLACGAAIRGLCGNNVRHLYPLVERGMVGMMTMFDMSRIIGTPSDPDAEREGEIVAAIAAKTTEVDRLVEAFGRESLDSVKRRISKIDGEILAHKVELEAHRRQSRIAEANRDRDMVGEFLALIQRMNEVMSPEERFLLRARLAAEFKRLITVITIDINKDLVVTMKTPAGSEPVNIRLLWAGVGTLGPYTAGNLADWGLFDIEGFRLPPHTETPIGEAWTPEELAAWRARG